MSRRDNRRTRATADTDAAADADDGDSVFDRGTSLDDLATPADPATFDQTFQVNSSDISVSPDANIPIAKPWQGIPRAAVVFNLNYIYNEEKSEWVRQKKSDLTEESGVGEEGEGDSVLSGTHIATSPDRAPAIQLTSAVNTTVLVEGSDSGATP